jgi:hypothetical protein
MTVFTMKEPCVKQNILYNIRNFDILEFKKYYHF